MKILYLRILSLLLLSSTFMSFNLYAANTTSTTWVTNNSKEKIKLTPRQGTPMQIRPEKINPNEKASVIGNKVPFGDHQTNFDIKNHDGKIIYCTITVSTHDVKGVKSDVKGKKICCSQPKWLEQNVMVAWGSLVKDSGVSITGGQRQLVYGVNVTECKP